MLGIHLPLGELIIIMTLKSTVSSLHCALSPACISCGQSTIVCISHATHQALIKGNMSCATRCKGTSWVIVSRELKLHLLSVLFHWMKPLTSEGREESRLGNTSLDVELQKMPHTKAQRFKPGLRLEPAPQHCWQASGKADKLCCVASTS